MCGAKRRLVAFVEAGDNPRAGLGDAIKQAAQARAPLASHDAAIARGRELVTAAEAELEALAAEAPQVAYPVAVGASAAAHALPLAETAQAYAQAWVANLVSAAVRLVPLGQSAGLRTLACLEPTISRVIAEGQAA